jgi:Myelin proteolipid protein (PLP or lipophilin)
MIAGGCCNDCMGRMPYATLIATVMCILGVGVFCFTVYRGATLSALMFDHVFHFRLAW